MKGAKPFKIVVEKLKEDLANVTFSRLEPNGNGTATQELFPRWDPTQFIDHPLPSIDEGRRQISMVTNVPPIPVEELAPLIARVNMHAVNAFLKQVRTRVSIMRRPTVGARGNAKSYIYSNFNPKYAQYMITILRTYYNFCLPIKKYSEKEPGKRRHVEARTPAERLGIASKTYDIEDILYFK